MYVGGEISLVHGTSEESLIDDSLHTVLVIHTLPIGEMSDFVQ